MVERADDLYGELGGVTAILANWIAGCGAIIGTVLLQFGAQALLMRLAARHRASLLRVGLRRPRFVLPILFVVFVLIFGHLLQMGVWALAYGALGELDGLANLFYFSVASYTSVGAAHLELSTQHRILGALEAGVGTLMFGWSTALLVALLMRTEAREAP